jgi:hypothetical protein
MERLLDASDTITLSSDEVLYLRGRLGLKGREESPFGHLEGEIDAQAEARILSVLAQRGLADSRSQRGHREVIRRLLIVAEPDSRVVLLRAGPAQGERLVDLYQRAGAFVAYARHQDRHRFGSPLELLDVVDEVCSYFSPNSSSSAAIDLILDPAEHFAFSILAQDVVARKRDGKIVRRHSLELPDGQGTSALDPSMDGAVLIPGKRGPVAPAIRPTADAWRSAILQLKLKNIVSEDESGLELRALFQDLALSLATDSRHVLTVFDFRSKEWDVKDVSFVSVGELVFILRTHADGALALKEVDAELFLETCRSAIEGTA